LNDYLTILKRYYIKLYNKANSKKDNLISKFQSTPEKSKEFLRRKRNHHNEKLEDFVTNSNEINRIIEYKGELIQKIDPIFNDPESEFLKAHFYAPRKQIFGVYYDIFNVNVAVIWFVCLVFYGILYFRLLKKALIYLENKQFIKKRKISK